ncbi:MULTISPECIES: hypothetical protein [Methylococcus]|uniref:Uncharacterized protein n=1 Tax=Methylococcus capsulatus TaxID=414 RepID=A0ABZ2F3U3_METCP|nr:MULTISPECIES: hypothetical protein [Methylococcus]MDF9393070.1 hypothetical protein [Methylococcus capsulatus]
MGPLTRRTAPAPGRGWLVRYGKMSKVAVIFTLNGFVSDPIRMLEFNGFSDYVLAIHVMALGCIL